MVHWYQSLPSMPQGMNLSQKQFTKCYRKCLIIGITVLFLSVLQYVVFGITMKLWAPSKPLPDRKTCDCQCWDTIFKGAYVKQLGGYYLHVYFNITPQTLKIWTLTVLMIITVYEVISHVVKLCIKRKVRIIMLLLLLSSIHSHYYTWWVLVGYLNDDFYKYWNHQILFSVTEMIASGGVLMMLNSEKAINENLLLLISTISVFHIIMGGLDQFVVNVLYGEGLFHQRLRDITLMVTDLINLFVSFILLLIHKTCFTSLSSDFIPTNAMKFRKKILICAVSVVFLILVTKLL